VEEIHEPAVDITRCDCEYGTDKDGPASGTDEGRDGRDKRADGNEHATLLGFGRGAVGASNLHLRLPLVSVEAYGRGPVLVDQGLGQLGILRHGNAGVGTRGQPLW